LVIVQCGSCSSISLSLIPNLVCLVRGLVLLAFTKAEPYHERNEEDETNSTYDSTNDSSDGRFLLRRTRSV
jgi:hypothetical protein